MPTNSSTSSSAVDVTMIGNIAGKIRFIILGDRKKLLLFTPSLDYDNIEGGSEIEFPATLVLIHSDEQRCVNFVSSISRYSYFMASLY